MAPLAMYEVENYNGSGRTATLRLNEKDAKRLNGTPVSEKAADKPARKSRTTRNKGGAAQADKSGDGSGAPTGGSGDGDTGSTGSGEGSGDGSGDS